MTCMSMYTITLPTKVSLIIYLFRPVILSHSVLDFCFISSRFSARVTIINQIINSTSIMEDIVNGKFLTIGKDPRIVRHYSSAES